VYFVRSLLLVFLVTGLRAAAPVSFQREIAPLLQRRCANCHSEENTKGDYRLDTFAALQKPGGSEALPLVPGKPAESELFRLLVEQDHDARMPQKADALPPGEIALIERWIKEGAAFDGGDSGRPLAEFARAVHLRPAPRHYARALPMTALAFSNDRQTIATSGYREVLLYAWETSTLPRRIGGLPERISALAWHPSENLLAVAGGTPGQWGTVALVDSKGKEPVRFLVDLPDLVLSLAYSPDGETLVAGCSDRTLRFFDRTGRPTKVVRQHADWVQSVAFNSAGTRLVSASRDRTARVLEAPDWHLSTTYQGHESPVLAAAFSPDSLRIFTVARGVGHVWHPESGNKRHDLLNLGGDIRQLAAGPFGVAGSGADGMVRIYQSGETQPWVLLPGHRASVQALAISSDGALLASGSADGEVIVWSPQCWAPVTRFSATPK
jgi:hypothetical protein